MGDLGGVIPSMKSFLCQILEIILSWLHRHPKSFIQVWILPIKCFLGARVWTHAAQMESLVHPSRPGFLDFCSPLVTFEENVFIKFKFSLMREINYQRIRFLQVNLIFRGTAYLLRSNFCPLGSNITPSDDVCSRLFTVLLHSCTIC